MIKNRLFLISIFLVLAQFSYSQATKVLFLGNSYTASNNLPELFFFLAESLGDDVIYDSYTPGGHRLMNHATNATTLSKIKEQQWDFVVLQAQSQEPSLDPVFLEEEVFPYANILNDSIKANNECTETVFFMTWGRKYGDQQNCASWPPVCSFLGMQQRLMAGYMMMAENTESTVAPVGLAWKHSMDNDPDSLINLYSGDYSHPSVAGSYLTACVMYATMFHKAPTGSTFYEGLTESQGIYLQQIASYVGLDDGYGFEFYDPYFEIDYNLSWLDWFQKGNIAIADFNVAQNMATYYFTNQSVNAESFLWDFDDGNTSTIESPDHTYYSSGEYVVSLTVNNSCFTDLTFNTLNVVISNNKESPVNNKISISQNKGTKNIAVSFTWGTKISNLKFEVISINGNVLITESLASHENIYNSVIDMAEYNPGVYFLRISLDDRTITKKFILK